MTAASARSRTIVSQTVFQVRADVPFTPAKIIEAVGDGFGVLAAPSMVRSGPAQPVGASP